MLWCEAFAFLQFSEDHPAGFHERIEIVKFNQYYKFYSVLANVADAVNYTVNPQYLVMNTFVETLANFFYFFTVKDLDLLLKAHGIPRNQGGRPMNKDRCIEELLNHRCFGRCSKLIYLFKVMASARKFGSLSRREVGSYPVDADQGFRDDFEISDPDDESHLNIPGEELKWAIINEWQREMGTDHLRLVVCAVCSKKISVVQSHWVDGNSFDLTLLRNDGLPDHLLPSSYCIVSYKMAILNPKGLESLDRVSSMRLCSMCFKSLSAGVMPKFALSNWLYYARDALPQNVKDCFASSTLFERMLISRARANTITCRFNSRDSQESSGRGQSALNRERKGMRGNVLVAPLDVIRMNAIIPPSSGNICDTMCALFVGDRLPTRETLSKYHPVLVRKSRVKDMIVFLLENNCHYKPSREFGFSEKNLDDLFEGEGDQSCEAIPSAVHIGYIPRDNVIDSATSDYTYRNVDSEGVDHATSDGVGDDLLMENVGYTEGDESPMSYQAMKVAAMEQCIRGKPFIVSGKGSQSVSEFGNPSILTWLFPHLDPWGIGGLHHPDRVVSITREEQVAHLLMIDDSPFERDPEFAFVFYNISRKANVSKTLRFIASRRDQRHIAENLLKINPEVLRSLYDNTENNARYRPDGEEEVFAFEVMTSLRMIARHVPGSDGYKIMRRNEIRALIAYRGTATLFVTLNLSDVDHPIVRLLGGEDVQLEDLSRGEDMSEWKRKLFAARNPSVCARFFDLFISKFIDIILRYGRDDNGIYGKCVGYYGTVEAQGKGTLHCHMLIWLKGHLSPQKLKNKMKSSETYRANVFRWLESIIKCEFPGFSDPHEQLANHPKRVHFKENGDPHPGTICAPLTRTYGANKSLFWSEYDKFVVQLLHQYCWHEHQATCWKYLERGQSMTDENCRLGMNGLIQEKTELDPTSASILLRWHHGKIAAHTDIVTFLLQCNMDIKFVGSGDAAKAFLYYVTDYITKPSLSVHVGMSALSYAVKRAHQRITLGIQTCTEKDSVGVVTTAVNSFMGRHEISHQQVMSYILGGGDHYKSDKFVVLQWGSVRGYVLERLSASNTAPTTNAEQVPEEESGTVTLTLGNQCVTGSNQQLDYVYRSREPLFDGLCLYDLVSRTLKRVISSPDDDREHVKGAFCSESHPQSKTHSLRLRKERYVPVFLGPKFPNPQRTTELKEEWVRDMLILFKPWRDPSDLKADNMTWSDTFHQFCTSGTMSAFHISVVENIQVLTECNEARDVHAQERYRGAGDFQTRALEEMVNNAGLVESSTYIMNVPDADPFSEFEDSNCDFILNDIFSEKDSRLLNSCLLITPEDLERKGSDAERVPSTISGSEQQMIDLQCANMTSKRKRKFRDMGGSDEEDGPPSRRRFRNNEPFSVITNLHDLRRPWMETKAQEMLNIQRVIDDMNLASNPEQLRVFNIVADHAVEYKSEQLLLYVEGVGGTGKSHVIKSIIKLFELLNRRNELLLGAPTGIAAYLIGGQTLHSLILSTPKKKSNDVTNLSAIWKGTRYLIVDEVSMLGARFLSEMSLKIRQGKGDNIVDSAKPFGGVNIIFMGDFGQLKPPKQFSLFTHELTKNPSFAAASTENGISAMNGVFLWRQVNQVVELTKNQRHEADPGYASFLARLRLGQCSQRAMPQTGVSDYEYLRSRLLENLAHDPVVAAEFRDAPIVVGSKALRDVLNAKLAKYHAKRFGRDLNLYYSTDSISKKVLVGQSRELLWSMPSSINQDALGRLPLFIGMKVMVTENLAFDHGIVNGTEGVVYDIKFEEGTPGQRHAKVVYILVAGSGIQLEGLPKDVAPIFPITTNITCPSFLRARGIEGKSVSRRQIPLVPAYAYTDFKAQGRTTTRLIADIATARGQGVYVMLSRVKTISGLMILRWFPPTKIYCRLSEELRDELNRLHALNVAGSID